jgi:uncharacterized phiE125 gp8 family phage protein
MSFIQISGPAVEPVSLSDAKAYMRVETTAEDDLIQAMLVAARTHIEAITGKLMITQGWRIILDGWPPSGIIPLPVSPLQAVTSVTMYDPDGNADELEASTYLVDTSSTPPRLVMRNAVSSSLRLINGIEIDITAGFGDISLDVPAPLRQAVLQLVAHWYDNRGPGFDPESSGVPAGLAKLVRPYQEARLS